MDKRFKAMTAIEKAEWLYAGGLRWISCKWFKRTGDEIQNIDRALARRGAFKDINDMETTKEAFIKMFGTEGPWPLPKIIEEAEAVELKPLCMPLNYKQLQIIKSLLLGGREYLFIITGVGGSGKSTYLNLITQIFENDYAPITLEQMSEGFRLASVVGKRLICSTEIGYNRVTDTLLKSIISNEPLNINPKNQKPYTATIRSSFIFSCNIPPSLNLADTGLIRRFIYYNMDEKIKNPDPSMNHKEWSKEDLLNVVKHAMQTNIDNIYEDFAEQTHMNLIKNDTVYMFPANTYSEYEFDCRRNGFKPYNRQNWLTVKQLLSDWRIKCSDTGATSP